MTRPRMNRRRFLVTAAACAGLPLASRAATPVVEWRGMALGAAARIRIAHPDPATARRALAACTAELARLEAVFSLYRPDSALSRLNADGGLTAPPADLVALLSLSLAFAEATGGAFDPTVQPLWDAHAAHFSRPGADPAGPPPGLLDPALARVGWRRVEATAAAIRLERGTRLTLNGAAQGWITDRLVDRLRDTGLADVLVDAGEIRAEGRHPWTSDRGPLAGALAVSSGDGTRFSPACHHLFDPRTGRSSQAVRRVAVTAPTAALADLAATAIAVDGPGMARRLERLHPGLRAELA